MCRQPLEDFHRKIQKFEKHLGVGNSREMLKDAAKKAQWAFGLGKNDEVGRLRSYLDIHIGVINMQLVQYGFEKADIASEERAADHQALKNSMDESVREVKGVRGSIQAQALVVKESNSMVRTLLDMVGGDIGAPLKALTGVITKVWYVFFKRLNCRRERVGSWNDLHFSQLNTNWTQVHQRSRSITSPLKYMRALAVLIPGLHTSNTLLRLKTYWDEFFRFPQSSVSQHLTQRSWIASKLGLESHRSLLVTTKFSMPKMRMSYLVLPLTRYFVRECLCLCLSSLTEERKRIIGAQCRIVNPRMSLTPVGENSGRHFQ